MSDSLENAAIAGDLDLSDVSTKGLPRAAEFFLALAALAALLPVLIVCALMVRFSSPGAILFRQKRVGRAGAAFTLYKFRTMFERREGSLVTAATDSRITPIGRMLRRTKLDELPELYNVLRGEMSFVGPRPEVPELVDLENPLWRQIVQARPGLTDPVTLSLRNEEAIIAAVEDQEKFYREIIQPYKINGYLQYLITKSLKNDLKIIVQTARVILLPKSAPPFNLTTSLKKKTQSV